MKHLSEATDFESLIWKTPEFKDNLQRNLTLGMIFSLQFYLQRSQKVLSGLFEVSDRYIWLK